MTEEHHPTASGIVLEAGSYDRSSTIDQRMRSVARKIEDHGEVHADFEGRDGEAELRLGTTKVDYDTDAFEVWDGDNYQTFAAERLVSAYKPMDVWHGGE